jgi:hypothetical protein
MYPLFISFFLGEEKTELGGFFLTPGPSPSSPPAPLQNGEGRNMREKGGGTIQEVPHNEG